MLLEYGSCTVGGPPRDLFFFVAVSEVFLEIFVGAFFEICFLTNVSHFGVLLEYSCRLQVEAGCSSSVLVLWAWSCVGLGLCGPVPGPVWACVEARQELQ